MATTDRNKIVQNYCLEELKSVNSDDSEIWLAKHKILKKNFTLKRLKYRGSQEAKQGPTQDRDEWCYQNVIRETELLKKINAEGCPKCHKMIKTSNNIYLVYDQFPGSPLNVHLSRNGMTRTEKLQLILEITKLTNFFHLRGMVFLNLSINNIHLYNQNSVFFSDWSLARNADTEQRINSAFIKKGTAGIAQELMEEGRYYRLSDIFSLGIIFREIINAGVAQSVDALSKDVRLLEMIELMIKEKVSDRPALREIIRVIQLCLANKDKDKAGESPIKMNFYDSIRSTRNLQNKSKSNLDMSADESKITNSKNNIGLQPKSEKVVLGLTKDRSSHSITIQTKRSNKTDHSGQQQQKSIKSANHLLSRTRIAQENKNKATITDFAKQINKKRNLAFFLMDLSEFVTRLWICPPLAYLLLKCAYLTLTETIQQCQKFDHQSSELRQFLSCIIREQAILLKNLGLLKQILINSHIKSSSFFKYELQQQKTVSERELKARVIEFSKEMVLFCEKQASNHSLQSDLIDYLFKTLMILKIIEQGSYEKFWEKVYLTDCAHLSSQTYFQKCKSVGIRNMRGQIAQILRK